MFSYRLHYLNIPKNVTNSGNVFLVCSSFKNLIFQSIKNYNAASVLLDTEKSKIFFSKEAQGIMKKLTGIDLEKVYRRRTTGGEYIAPPKYEFMTNEQLKTAQANAIRRAYRKLQMPPLVPVNKGQVEVLDERPEMIGFTKSKYVFTDISYNVSDKKRLIVVREPDGVLRRALPYERHRMNELYFPRRGRSYEHPKMFQKENLRRILEQGDYEFILDRACIQFEPDNEEYHDSVFYTFDVVNEKKDFNKLRSTRHFGPMVFYLSLNKDVKKLLEENLETERFDDAVNVAKLFCIVNPDCKFNSLNMDQENNVEYLKKFIELECQRPERLLQLVDTYYQAQKNPVHQNNG